MCRAPLYGSTARYIGCRRFSAALLGLAVMTMFGKRGSAVLDAPEESYAQETEWTAPEPAPPGTLHHSFGSDPFAPQPVQAPDHEAWPAQNVPSRYRLRVGIPGTWAGRVALGAGLLFVFGLAGAGILAARYSVLHDEHFVVAEESDIEIEGNHHLTRSQILDVFRHDVERNIFQVPLSQRGEDLQRLPWVEHAAVMRLLPNRVRIHIVERLPVAFVRQGARIGLVDANGVLLDMPQDDSGDPSYSFPVLTGISAGDPLPARAARMELYRRFMLDLDSSGEKFTQFLSEVDVSDPEDVKALIASGSTDILVHFGDEDFLKRYRLFQQNLPQWKLQYPKLAAVDTRYEHELVLEMTPGTAAPLAGSDGAPAKAAKAIVAKANAKHPVKPVVAPEQHKPVAPVTSKSAPAHATSAHEAKKP